MRHTLVQRNLYEYLKGEMPETDRRKMAGHLESCARCASELNELQTTLRLVQQHSFNPSKVRLDTYWQLFANKVEKRIQEAGHDQVRSSITEFVLSLIGKRKQFVVGFASALGLVLVAFALWRVSLPSLQEETFVSHDTQPGGGAFRTASLETRTYDYLERSKVLLVGLVNADPEVMKTSKVDLTRQKEISRGLLRESRELAASLNGPSQMRLKRLVGDLEVILLQIANLESEFDSPGVEIVKGGVERRNILLKINLAEIQHAGESASAVGRTF